MRVCVFVCVFGGGGSEGCRVLRASKLLIQEQTLFFRNNPPLKTVLSSRARLFKTNDVVS